MEYYLLRQSGRVTNAVRLGDLDQWVYTARMTHDDFRKLDTLKNAYIEYDRCREFPDLLIQEKKPSIRKLLSTLKEAAQGKNAERAKVKNKDREVSL